MEIPMNPVINLQAEIKGFEATYKKASQLVEKMQEVKTLADELTAYFSDLKLEIKY